MSFETTRDPERFRHLERLFELLLTVDPERWDEFVADRALDPRLAIEARKLLLLKESGEPHRYLSHLVSAARTVLSVDTDHPEGGLHVGPADMD